MNTFIKTCCFLFPFVFVLQNTTQADPFSLPLATKHDITKHYQGSFKIEYADSISSTDYAKGRVAYNPKNNSVFIDSHVYQLAIGEFKIPDLLSLSIDKSLLPSGDVIQGFTTVIDKPNTSNTQGLDRIGGLLFENNQLIIQVYRTYDANGADTHTTLVARTPGDLSTSKFDGFYEMDGSARTVNYLSPIPLIWQKVLSGTHIAGNGSGMSISSRYSEGPSLYAFDIADLFTKSPTITTTKWLDYPAMKALSTSIWQDNTTPGYGNFDLYNKTTLNDMWTIASAAWFGFIIPGTRTFAVLGESGMHASGGGYKIINDEGYQCPGPCAKDNEDYHSYYWLYDLKDIVNATNSFDPIPYEYGVFDDTWMQYSPQGGVGGITGGSFDIETGTLVLSHKAATKNHESGHPVISVYKFPPLPSAPDNIGITININ